MGDPVSVLAAQVRRLRDARGWSAQRLADELAAVGAPLDRSVIANLENGRRASVDIQELFALALALEVTPLDLLVPPEISDDAPYAVTPERTEPAGRVRAWLGGKWLTEPSTAAELARAISGMPEGRARRLAAGWLGDAGQPPSVAAGAARLGPLATLRSVEQARGA